MTIRWALNPRIQRMLLPDSRGVRWRRTSGCRFANIPALSSAAAAHSKTSSARRTRRRSRASAPLYRHCTQSKPTPRTAPRLRHPTRQSSRLDAGSAAAAPLETGPADSVSNLQRHPSSTRVGWPTDQQCSTARCPMPRRRRRWCEAQLGSQAAERALPRSRLSYRVRQPCSTTRLAHSWILETGPLPAAWSPRRLSRRLRIARTFQAGRDRSAHAPTHTQKPTRRRLQLEANDGFQSSTGRLQRAAGCGTDSTQTALACLVPFVQLLQLCCFCFAGYTRACCFICSH